MEQSSEQPAHKASFDQLPHLFRMRVRHRQTTSKPSAPLSAASDDLKRLDSAPAAEPLASETKRDIERRIAHIQLDLTRIRDLLQSVLTPGSSTPLQAETLREFQGGDTNVLDEQRHGPPRAH